jgi:hypothetical protein
MTALISIQGGQYLGVKMLQIVRVVTVSVGQDLMNSLQNILQGHTDEVNVRLKILQESGCKIESVSAMFCSDCVIETILYQSEDGSARLC